MENDLINQAKKSAAYAAVDEFIQDWMIVGIGSGSTVIYVAERIAEKIKNDKNISVKCNN